MRPKKGSQRKRLVAERLLVIMEAKTLMDNREVIPETGPKRVGIRSANHHTVWTALVLCIRFENLN